MMRRISASFLVLVLSVALALTSALPCSVALADSQTGTIALRLITGSGSEASKMKDGKVSIYKVANIDYSKSAPFDTSAGQFSNGASARTISTMSSADLDKKNSELSQALDTERKSSSVAAVQTAQVANGEAKFESVEYGLYLVSQTDASSDKLVMESFLIALPTTAGDNYLIANPKVSSPTEPVTPDPDEPEPDKPDPDKPEPDKPEPDKPDPDKPEPDNPDPDNPDNPGKDPTNPENSDNTGGGISTKDTSNLNWFVDNVLSNGGGHAPQTGDGSLGFMAFLMVGAGLVLVGIAIKNRKKDGA